MSDDIRVVDIVDRHSADRRIVIKVVIHLLRPAAESKHCHSFIYVLAAVVDRAGFDQLIHARAHELSVDAEVFLFFQQHTHCIGHLAYSKLDTSTVRDPLDNVLRDFDIVFRRLRQRQHRQLDL